MLSTNLLPAKQKNIIWCEEIRRSVRFFTIAVISVFVVASALLSPSYLPIVMTTRDFERRLSMEEETAHTLRSLETIDETKQLKRRIRSLKERFSSPPKALPLLSQFLNELPPGIAVSSFTLNKNGEVSMRGEAETRKDLLQFEQVLRESGKFEGISSPLSNIIRETDINFFIQSKLKTRFGL